MTVESIGVSLGGMKWERETCESGEEEGIVECFGGVVEDEGFGRVLR